MTQTQSIDKNAAKAPCKKLRTAKQAKLWLRRNGLTYKEFAKLHGFTEKSVSKILNGERKALYGKGYKIAVALGMKSPDQP